MAFPSVGGHHPIHWGPEENKAEAGDICPLPDCCRLGTDLLLTLIFLAPSSWGLDWNLHYPFSGSQALHHTTSFPGVPVCREQTMEPFL